VLRDALKNARAQGYAMENAEEELNIRCVAVPVLTARGDALAALSITGTMGELRESQIANVVAQLRQTAAMVLRRLQDLEGTNATF